MITGQKHIMRFGVVISDPDDWTARAILASFRKRCADAVFLNFSELAASVKADPDLKFSSNGIDLLDLDGLVVRDLGRRGAHDVAFRFETLQALKDLGIAIINPPAAIARAANKFSTTLALQAAGVPTPETTITTSYKEARAALRDYGRAVSKPLFGYKGRDIVRLEDENASDEDLLRSIIDRQGLVYLQEFIHLQSPRDIRAFVVGDRVMGSIYRVAPKGQWITNLARGGSGLPCELDQGQKDLAVRASMAVGTVYAGVDLLETPDGLKVIEVNGTPSGKGIFEALGVDVTKAIADYVLQAVASK
jgi:tetrahydromethanopterin:alpha-L-glutamate ligase